MRAALRDAGLESHAIEYVNAHATGTPVGDTAEASATRRVVPHAKVSSIKGAVGHTIAAAGAIEAAACVAALERGFRFGGGFRPSIPDGGGRGETAHRACPRGGDVEQLRLRGTECLPRFRSSGGAAWLSVVQ